MEQSSNRYNSQLFHPTREHSQNHFINHLSSVHCRSVTDSFELQIQHSIREEAADFQAVPPPRLQPNASTASSWLPGPQPFCNGSLAGAAKLNINPAERIRSIDRAPKVRVQHVTLSMIT